MGLKQWMPAVVVVACLILDLTEGKKNNVKRKEDFDDDDVGSGRPNLLIDSDRSKIFGDPETSAQGINPAVQNPLANQLLYQNQAGLYQNGGGFGGGFGGGLANLGGGVFSNQGGIGNPYLNGYQNPYLQGGGGLGGLGGLGQLGGLGGIGGIGGGYGGLAGLGGLGGFGGAPDIYTQGALAAQLYNNPLYGAGGGLTGSAAGINPLLLRGAQNIQYPVVGGLGGYNPYLATQALLSPYNNYNQLNNYPFSSRFGIGAGRSAFNRYNSQSNISNNDEK